MSRIFPIFVALILFIAGYGVHCSCVTRMNVVEYFENVVHGDGIRVEWGRKANSWTDLIRQKIESDGNKTLLMEGDVYLQRFPKTIPVMVKSEKDDLGPLPFKQWLKEAALTKKALRINFVSTSVVKPAMRYLFSTNKHLHSPIILHADVSRMTTDSPTAVDPNVFVKSATELFPDASISVGWTVPQSPAQSIQYTWRNIFDILEHVHQVHRPLHFSVHAKLLLDNYAQMSWLLGMRESVSLHVRSNSTDVIDEWTTLSKLRRWQDHSRILYDMPSHHKRQVVTRAKWVPELEPKTIWKSHEWEVVQFTEPTALLSTVIKSKVAPAFLGWPTAFLLSRKRPSAVATEIQSVSGEVLFVPKPAFREINPAEETGLSIFLLDSLDDIGSPRLTGGIQIFIGYDGNLFIENRAKQHTSPFNTRSHFWPSVMRSQSFLELSSCYSFYISDSGYSVDMWVEATTCVGQSRSSPVARSWMRRLRLDTAPSRYGQRYVVLQKTGDGTVDCIVHHLTHSMAHSLIVPQLVAILASAALTILRTVY